MKRHLLPLALIGLVLPVFAEEQDQVALRFLSYPKNANPEPVELWIGEGATIEVQAPTNALSQAYHVKRQTSWSLGKKQSANNEGEASSFTSYGSAPALASSDQLIVLIRNGGENKDGLRVIPIDNSTTNLRGGQFFFMNESRVLLVGRLGGREFTLQPGEYRIIEAGEMIQREGTDHFIAEILVHKQDETRPFFATTWPINKKARSLVFFGHEGNGDRIRMHTIRDYLP